VLSDAGVSLYLMVKEKQFLFRRGHVDFPLDSFTASKKLFLLQKFQERITVFLVTIFVVNLKTKL